jgi:para-nitrobenzyl esterase
MAFAFDNVARSTGLLGDGHTETQKLADAMSGAWAAFAATGAPNREGLMRWPEYDAITRATMVFDNPPRIENDPDRATRLLFAAHDLRERI